MRPIDGVRRFIRMVRPGLLTWINELEEWCPGEGTKEARLARGFVNLSRSCLSPAQASFITIMPNMFAAPSARSDMLEMCR